MYVRIYVLRKQTYASYGIPGTRPRYCAKHREGDMVNLTVKKCEAYGCPMQPNFNFEGQRKARWETPPCRLWGGVVNSRLCCHRVPSSRQKVACIRLVRLYRGYIWLVSLLTTTVMVSIHRLSSIFRRVRFDCVDPGVATSTSWKVWSTCWTGVAPKAAATDSRYTATLGKCRGSRRGAPITALI